MPPSGRARSTTRPISAASRISCRGRSIAEPRRSPPIRLPRSSTAAACRWPRRSRARSCRSPAPAWSRTSRPSWRGWPTSSGTRRFPPRRSSRAAARSITLIRQDEDNPAAVAVDGLMEMLYGDDASVRASAARDGRDRRAHRRRRPQALSCTHISPSSVSLAVVGDVEPERAVDAASAAFGAGGQPRAVRRSSSHRSSSRPAAVRG